MKKNAKTIVSLGFTAVLGAAAYAASHMAKQYAPTKEKPHSDAPIITALGDSITFGAGVPKTRSADTWEVKLEKLLEGKYQVLNYGISGATLQDEADFPYWKMKVPQLRYFPEAAMALNPQIILLMLGTNDSKPYNWNRERYEKELYARAAELKAACPRLILMCPPFACPAEGSDTVAFDILNETIRDEIRPMIHKCAEDLGVECIDLYTLTDGHGEYFMDGVHPNAFGNFVIAKHICDYLTAE